MSKIRKKVDKLVDFIDLRCHWLLQRWYARITGSHLRYFLAKHGFGVEDVPHNGFFFKSTHEPLVNAKRGGRLISMAGITSVFIHHV